MFLTVALSLFMPLGVSFLFAVVCVAGIARATGDLERLLVDARVAAPARGRVQAEMRDLASQLNFRGKADIESLDLAQWIEKPPAALIVPLEDDHVWLVEQFRHPVGRRFWEFPQGAWEDEPGAAPEDLARGELAEETGLRAATLERLGRLYFAYGITDQPVDVWLATGLEPGPSRPPAAPILANLDEGGGDWGTHPIMP